MKMVFRCAILSEKQLFEEFQAKRMKPPKDLGVMDLIQRKYIL